MAANILGITISIIGLIWTAYGFWSSEQLKKALLQEKDFIKDTILNIRAPLEKNRKIIINDRQASGDPKLNHVPMRIEDIESILDMIDRFKIRLDSIK
jgi:hypothetical protein